MKEIILILCGCFILQSCCAINPFDKCPDIRGAIEEMSKFDMPKNTTCAEKEATEPHETAGA